MTWIDFTRRNDPACIQGFKQLKVKLKQHGFPDVFCFWSKNPQGIATLFARIIKQMQDKGTIVLAQFTINNYGLLLEPGIEPDMLDLSGIIKLLSPDKIRLRFDPIIPGFTTPAHFKATVQIAQDHGISRIITNFLVPEYKGVGKLLRDKGIPVKDLTDSDKTKVLNKMLSMLKSTGIDLAICAESAKFAGDKIKAAACSDPAWAMQFGVAGLKTRPSRKGCGCCYSDDWGQYRSQGGYACPHQCLYCYAK